jgi:hypothetical protein
MRADCSSKREADQKDMRRVDMLSALTQRELVVDDAASESGARARTRDPRERYAQGAPWKELGQVATESTVAYFERLAASNIPSLSSSLAPPPTITPILVPSSGSSKPTVSSLAASSTLTAQSVRNEGLEANQAAIAHLKSLTFDAENLGCVAFGEANGH